VVPGSRCEGYADVRVSMTAVTISHLQIFALFSFLMHLFLAVGKDAVKLRGLLVPRLASLYLLLFEQRLTGSFLNSLMC